MLPGGGSVVVSGLVGVKNWCVMPHLRPIFFFKIKSFEAGQVSFARSPVTVHIS